jgi:hypothetical protein
LAVFALREQKRKTRNTKIPMDFVQTGGFARLTDDQSEEAAIKQGTKSVEPLSSSVSVSVHSPQAVPNEYDKLRREDSSSWQRIGRLELTASERDVLSLSVRKMNDLGEWAEAYRRRGARLFATQVLCAAAVPVLIGMLGSFNDPNTEFAVRVIAIVLSITGTTTKALEDAYDWRGQAAIRRRCLTRMRLLFDNFCVLSGEIFDPASTGVNVNKSVRDRKFQSRHEILANGGQGIFANGVGTSSITSAGGKEGPALSPQAQLAAALDELRMQHSGANLRRYVVAFSALEDACSSQLSALHDRNNAS